MTSPSENLTPKLLYSFEEAVRLTGTGIFHYQLLFTCGLCFLTVMSQILCVSVIMPSVKCDTDIQATLKERGLLASAGFFGIVCSSHIMGFLGDTWGRVNTVKLSVILSTITSIISSFSVNIWMLIITRFLTGFFASGCQSCVYSLCSEFHSEKTRVRHVTLVSVFLPLSLVYVPMEGIFILPLHIDLTFFGLNMAPWRFLLLAINITPIFALILLCFTPETPKYDLVHGNHEKALNTLRKIFKINTRRPMDEYPVSQITVETTGANIMDIHGVKDALKMICNQTCAIFHKDRIWHTLNICILIALMYAIAHGILMWYPTILLDAINHKKDLLCLTISEIGKSEDKKGNKCEGQNDSFMSWLVIFLGIALTVSYLLIVFTIQFVGKKNVLIFVIIICSMFCIAVHWASNLPLAAAALTIISSVGNCSGILSTIAVEFFPTNINAMSMCFVMMIGRLGAAAGSNLIGYYIFKHCNILFWVLTVVLLIMAVMSWLLPDTKSKKSDEDQ